MSDVVKLLDTSTEAQRRRVLVLLMEAPRSTFELRDEHNIMMPGARIKELKKSGHDIATIRSDLPDRYGRMHPRVATYSLVKLAGEGEVAA